MSETAADRLPEPGDVITFPEAPMEFNRALRYTVLDVRGDLITFMHDDRNATYTYPAEDLRAIGMTSSDQEKAATP